MSRPALCLCALLVAAGERSAAPSSWVEVRSGHFTVFTDAGEKAGRRAAWQFEQIRGALLRMWPWAKIDSRQRFVVFAVKNEASLKTLGPQHWEGKRFRPVAFGAQGRDRQYIALRTDVEEPSGVNANPYQTAYWQYVASVFTSSFPRNLPEWYSRGIAEVVGNTVVRANELHVGRVMQGNLDRVREGPLIPLNEFLSADSRSHWVTQQSDVALFDAQAWALVHYLIFGQQGAHARKLDRFNRLLLGGAAPETALKEAFGDMTPYQSGMREYIQRGLFAYARIPVALDARPEGFTIRALSVGEAAVRRGELLVAMKRPIEARAFAAEATRADASHPGPWEIEGELLDAEGRHDQAKTAFAKAVELGSQRAHVFYRLAQLEWSPSPDEALLKRIAADLQRALDLDPQSADALSFLADTLAGLGRLDEALEMASKAVEIAPAESYHRITMARILWKEQRPDDALQMAQWALQTADNETERRRAQEFLDFAGRTPQPRPVDAAPEAAATPSAGPSRTGVMASAPAGLRGVGSVSACFDKREDSACAEAAPALEDACQSGEGVACRSLGSLYDGGWGVGVDKSRAALAYDRGCRGGDRPSCARLAVLQARGEGIARDPVRALSTLQRLCAEKVDDACIGWALLLAARSSKAELAKARELLQATCDRKNDEACRLLKSLPR